MDDTPYRLSRRHALGTLGGAALLAAWPAVAVIHCISLCPQHLSIFRRKC